VFDIQIRLASRLGLPVIIHCRDGLKETLDVLCGQSQLPPLIFHSFGGSVDDVALIREIASDVMFGINGIVTFKNSGLRSVLSDIGLSSMLLETDSPYLAPVPKRGKRNESSYIPFIAQTIADTLGTDIKEVADVTTGNAIRLFHLKL
ncbi:MAG: TatD family hydrolase, partial [Paramuribaculum sp.]|nr:TatD family hydrolase [Paramuribaculum sp.]